MWRWPWQKLPELVKPPKVGGTRAPAEIHQIDFGKPHDFHFRFGYDRAEPTVLRGCRLVGFTTPMEDGESAGSEFREYAHNRWLVLRQRDGRLLYAPRDSLLYIEESIENDHDSDLGSIESPRESSPQVSNGGHGA